MSPVVERKLSGESSHGMLPRLSSVYGPVADCPLLAIRSQKAAVRQMTQKQTSAKPRKSLETLGLTPITHGLNPTRPTRSLRLSRFQYPADFRVFEVMVRRVAQPSRNAPKPAGQQTTQLRTFRRPALEACFASIVGRSRLYENPDSGP